MKKEQEQGVLRCASQSAPPHPLTSARRKTLPPLTTTDDRGGSDHKKILSVGGQTMEAGVLMLIRLIIEALKALFAYLKTDEEVIE